MRHFKLCGLTCRHPFIRRPTGFIEEARKENHYMSGYSF